MKKRLIGEEVYSTFSYPCVVTYIQGLRYNTGASYMCRFLDFDFVFIADDLNLLMLKAQIELKNHLAYLDWAEESFPRSSKLSDISIKYPDNKIDGAEIVATFYAKIEREILC